MINGLTVYSEECPEVTLDNVISTFQHLHASKNETFVTGIIDVFRKLSGTTKQIILAVWARKLYSKVFYP